MKESLEFDALDFKLITSSFLQKFIFKIKTYQ